MSSFLVPAPKDFVRCSSPVPGMQFTSSLPHGYAKFVQKMRTMPKLLKVRGASGSRLGNIRGGMLAPSTPDRDQEQETVVYEGSGCTGCHQGECTVTDSHFLDFNAAFVLET